MIFLTFNDPVNGIFSSQVTDVCSQLRKMNRKVVLISCFPGRIFQAEAYRLKAEDASAISVKARFPLRFYRWNGFFLKKFFSGDEQTPVIARGAFACSLALDLRKQGLAGRIIYDGRGAVEPEFREFKLGSASHRRLAEEAERRSVLESDMRIAVSEKLVGYWKDAFGYNGNSHVVIPCTLNSSLSLPELSPGRRKAMREKFGIGESDVVFVHAGGTGSWQSAELLNAFVSEVFPHSEKFRLHLLSQADFSACDAFKKFSGRITRSWEPHTKVPEVLSMADYGLLLREKSVTNMVSSPVKFAEYLAAGLKVIISREVGDYSDLVVRNKLGELWNEGSVLVPSALRQDERESMQEFAIKNLSKQSSRISGAYRELAGLEKSA